MLIIGLVLCFCELVLSAEQVQYAPTIQLKDGKVLGIVEEASPGYKVYNYQGIRYGRANRFEKPHPVKPWTGIYDAIGYRDACPQLGVGEGDNVLPNHTETMSEDCLFVNVWRPANEKVNLTVMVWIHGGGFASGTIFATAYDGRYLAAQGDVVVVSINYRLAAYGFLYGGTSDTPGNLGLHDQILALKWVQNNIAHFGGDPNQVTIFGESAGSMSVGSLILSPLANGLFQRAIMQSGAPNSYWAKMSQTEAVTLTKKLGQHLECTGVQMVEIVKCLRLKSIEQILNSSYAVSAMESTSFKPIYGDSLLPIEPEIALKTGKFNHVDLLFGVTSRESAFFVRFLVPEIENGTELTLESTKKAIKQAIDYFVKLPYVEEVVDRYTENSSALKTQNDLKVAIADAWGHFFVICPTILFGEEYARQIPKNRFYSYQLVHPTPQLGCSGWEHVCHGDDLVYLFMVPIIEQISKQNQLSKDMIHTWSQFAKTGHPGKIGSLDWTEAFDRLATDHSIRDPVTKFMSLDPTNYKMVANFYKQTCNAFWRAKLLP